jgi:hypothetical protein
MARRPEPPDEEDDIPPPAKKRDPPKSEKRRAAAVADDDEGAVEDARDETDGPPLETKKEGEKTLSELSDKGLLKRLLRYTDEFRMLSTDDTQAAMLRRVELRRLMRGIQDIRDAREPLVEIQVPASVTGEPFTLGPLAFHPGLHRVRASIAQYLLWLIGENQRIELNRLKQNGRTIDLGTIGSRARMARISRDDGATDYDGRGV